MLPYFDRQPILESAEIRLQPLKETDFEVLYAVASDPLVWEQHPNKNRFQRDVFLTFFSGALNSGGAFLIVKKSTGEVMGSTRFYDADDKNRSVAIGYTFYGRRFWGGRYNPIAKTLMLNHAFKFVDNVYFHIGANNLRSQRAIEKLGAKKVEEKSIAYHGEENNLNFIYLIQRVDWNK